MQQQMGMGMAAAPNEIQKVYQSEKENLELVKHEWDCEDVEKRLLGPKYFSSSTPEIKEDKSTAFKKKR
jgi:hypothetical protein